MTQPNAQPGAARIDPQLAQGDLVKVAGAHNQSEAEFVQNLLSEEGVPSSLRRTRGFDVPDFLAAGPRDVLVPASGVNVAREVLLEADLEPLMHDSGPPIAPLPVLAGVVAGIVLLLAVAWLGVELLM